MTMQSLEYQTEYENFHRLLIQLQDLLAQNSQEQKAITKTFQDIQIFFSDRLIGLDPNLMNQTTAEKIQSYLTEIHKQLKMISIDMAFLRTSRDSETAISHRQNISDRLHLLMSYCTAIQGLEF